MTSFGPPARPGELVGPASDVDGEQAVRRATGSWNRSRELVTLQVEVCVRGRVPDHTKLTVALVRGKDFRPHHADILMTGVPGAGERARGTRASPNSPTVRSRSA